MSWFAADLSTGDRTVFADRCQMQQVVLNLIMNGIEAMSAVMDRPKGADDIFERVESGTFLLRSRIRARG